MRPLRVLHLRDTHEVGGPGKTILETFRAIDRTSVDMQLAVFLTRHESGDTPFVRAAGEYGLPVHFIRGANQYDPRLITGIAGLADRLGVDILHAHEPKSDVLASVVSRVRRIHIVTTLHGWIGNSARDRLKIALDKRVLPRFDRIIAVSQTIGEAALAAGAAPDRVRVLHNAIVIERYRRTGVRGFLQSALGRTLEPPVITCIGRISLEKGQADLVDAFAELADRGRRFSAVFVGDGSARPALIDRVARLGLESRVHFAGYRTETSRILEDSDLMVLPSHTEGLPNVVLEAMAVGVPVLATRVGGTPEVIVDGDCGRLVPPHQPAQLARQIDCFLAAPAQWRAMAERGRRRVEDHFNFETRTRRLEGIYSELRERVGR